MSSAQPSPIVYTIDESDASLTIVIPARKNWFSIITLIAWSTLWTFFTFLTAGSLLVLLVSALFERVTEIFNTPSGFSLTNPTGLFGAIVLSITLLGTGFLVVPKNIRALSWQLVGKEIVRIDPRSITMCRHVLRFGRSRVCTIAEVRDAYVAPIDPGPRGDSRHTFGWLSADDFWKVSDGSIVLDDSVTCHRFGARLKEEDANQILAEIRRRFPEFQVWHA